MRDFLEERLSKRYYMTMSLNYRLKRVLALSLPLVWALAAQAQLISGVTDRITYTDAATFNVATNAGYTYAVTLNGAPIAAGVSHTIRRMDYYDLVARRTQVSDGAVVNQLVRFIVLSSNRGSPERGLIEWTPYPPTPSAEAEFAGGQLQVVAPAEYPGTLPLPVIAWVDDGPGNGRRVNGNIAITGFSGGPLPLRRGVGHVLLSASGGSGPTPLQASIGGLTVNDSVYIDTSTTWVNVSGTLPAGTVWGENSRIRVTGHITIAAGNTLTVEPGTIVQLNPGVNITNSGRTVINGTLTQPVVFTSTNVVAPERHTGAWGGFLLRGTSAELIANGAIMTGAGAAPSFSFSPGASHRSEQALLLVHSGARAFLTNCFLINNAGQIGNGYNSDVTYDHCVLQRAITAGEYVGGTIIVNNSAVIEFPAVDGEVNAAIADADYDAIYFTTGTHIMQNSLFGFCKDDAIDSGSGGAGTVVVSNCWVESALHEALAWSGGGRQTWTWDSVIINSGQGLECGWSEGANTPLVYADRMLSLGNSVGARYGDNYEGTSGLGLKDGFLTVSNSFILYNYRDVWGQVWDNTWNYRVADMDVHDNYISQANTNHPNNTVWNPAAHASLLRPFMRTPPTAAVGLGFANWRPLTLSSLSNGIPIRLSTYTTNVVSVDYAVRTPNATFASGTLTFQPGETVKHIFAPASGVSTQDLVRVALSNPVRAEITTASQILITPAGSGDSTNSPIVTFNSIWRYLDTGVDQGTAWRASGFNDSNWPMNCAQFGYNDGDECTTISFGPNASAKYPTSYFRKSVNIPDPTVFTNLSMRLLRDDGGVVYINGTERFRSPTLPQPPAIIVYSTLATNQSVSSAPPDNTVDTTTLNRNVLAAGTNVIAVEVHQHRGDSSDLSFDLELMGNLVAQAPRLNIARFEDELVLYWGNSSFNLQHADEISPDANWTTISGASSPVTISPADTKRFYRLRR
jgi:hypothetical protein